MFDFRKKVLGPLVGRITRDIDAARQPGNIGKWIENLLSAKEAGETALEKVASREFFKAAAVLSAQIIVGLSLITASLGDLLPGFVAGLFFAAAFAAKKACNLDETREETRRFKIKIESEVQGLAAAAPDEALKSPRFLKALKERFNLSSATPETELKQLRLLLAPAPAATPAFKEGAKP